MRWIYTKLPGPTAVKIPLSILLIAIALVGLHFFYEWLSHTLVDTGGTFG